MKPEFQCRFSRTLDLFLLLFHKKAIFKLLYKVDGCTVRTCCRVHLVYRWCLTFTISTRRCTCLQCHSAGAWVYGPSSDLRVRLLIGVVN